MHFASDNWAGAHPKVAAALAMAGGGFDPAYGAGAVDKSVAATFSQIFERDVAMLFVATGTAANSLSLALNARPGGIAFCHREAHVAEDECGAPEFFTGGRLHLVDGPLGRMDVEQLEKSVSRFFPRVVHSGQGTAVTITQSTESGTVYNLGEIDAIGAIAKRHGLVFHMDGARFANALVSLDTTPAEMTWKRGVDILSFGGTKNGCWCAEAIVLFDPSRLEEMTFIRKRAAQLFSKSRFVAAQFEAYFHEDLWLASARHANSMAARLADAIRQSGRARLAWEPQANEVFAILDNGAMKAALAAGAAFYDWKPPHGFAGSIGDNETLCRFVASFATTPDHVDDFSALLAH